MDCQAQVDPVRQGDMAASWTFASQLFEIGGGSVNQLGEFASELPPLPMGDLFADPLLKGFNGCAGD